MQPLIIVGVVTLIAVVGILAYISARKRREAMGALAARLGLSFNPNKNWDLAERYHFLDKLRRGSNRYAFNILSGDYQGHNVVLFDYHYQIRSDKSTHHHYFSFFVLHLPRSFPEMIIDKEGFFLKVAQAIGYDDIDFESHEFSRRFCVRSRDKKFAYDICNARMIEYLLANSDLSIEIEGDALAISFSRRLAPEQIEPNLNRLITVRSLIPDYLFSRS
jgi:hypothetical protein